MCRTKRCVELVFALASAMVLVGTGAARAEAPMHETAPEVPPAGATASDPLPVAGPSGSPASLDEILASANVTAPASPLPDDFICFGNEPFWSLSIEGGIAATYNTPDLKLPQSYTVADILTARGRVDYPVALELYAGLRSAWAVIEHEACSDGMSDNTHLWSAQLLLKDQQGVSFLTGCCRAP